MAGSAATPGRLKLRARDHADFEVISAVLQDALVAISDMTQLPRERRFVLLATRFRWEARAPLHDLPDQARQETPERPGDARFEDAPLYERVKCGVTFDRVAGVRYRGFRKSESDRILNLLALVSHDDGVTLEFSEGAALWLQGRRIVCHLEDLGEPWPTWWRPSHDPEEVAAALEPGEDAGEGAPGGETQSDSDGEAR